MTHKKLKNKIAKILRMYFDITFVDSMYISNVMVKDYANPEHFLNSSEEDLMRTLFQLKVLEFDNNIIVEIIQDAIGVESLGMVTTHYYNDDGYAVKLKLSNYKTGKTTIVID